MKPDYHFRIMTEAPQQPARFPRVLHGAPVALATSPLAGRPESEPNRELSPLRHVTAPNAKMPRQQERNGVT
jgi:hypothetical protein